MDAVHNPEVTMTGELLSHVGHKNGRTCMAATTLPGGDHDWGAQSQRYKNVRRSIATTTLPGGDYDWGA